MRRSRTSLIAVVLAGVAIVAGPACGGPDAAEPREGSERGELTVAVAASLALPVEELVRRFEATHPGVTVRLDVAGSPALVAQVEQGAPIDLIATADDATMRRLEAADLLAGPTHVLAHNEMAIVVGEGNPLAITSLDDLTRPDIAVSLCAPEVPCGRFADQVLAGAGLTVTPRTREDSVAGVVTKVELGEVDAGIAYITDATAAADRTDTVRIAPEDNVITAAPIALPRTARNRALAGELLDVLVSPEAAEVFARHGFRRD